MRTFWSQIKHSQGWAFRGLSLLVVALACVVFLADQLLFDHPYAVMAEYQGAGVKTLQVQLETKKGLQAQELRENRSGDLTTVGRASFKTRRPAEVFVFSLLDAQGKALPASQFVKVSVTNRWGQASPAATTFAGDAVRVSPVAGSWAQAWQLNGLKFGLVFLLTLVGGSVLQRARSLEAHRWSLLGIWALVVLLTLMAGEVISDRPIYGDGVGQLRAAYNLYMHGVFAEQLGNPPQPDNFIEPFPAFVNSIYMRIMDAWGLGPLAFDHLHWGPLAIWVKQVNMFWVMLGQLTLGVFVYAQTRRWTWAAAAMVLAHVFFFGNYRVVDTFYTEVQGGVLLLMSSVALFYTVERKSLWAAGSAGVLLALLALTKASFYYINVIALLVLVGVLWFAVKSQQMDSYQRALRLGVLVLVGYVVVLGPWIARNHALFGSTAISDRGGVVLYIRATKNQMTAEEVRGALYLYGPSLYQHLGNKWGYAKPSNNELDPNEGAWIRVNRNRSPHSFFASVKAELKQAMSVPDANGKTKTLNEVAADMNRTAIASILNQPLKHLGMSFVFLWRGMWGVSPIDFYGVKAHHDLIVAELGLLSFYAMAFVFLVMAWVKRRLSMIMLSLLALGGVSFYAGLSHFLPRYMLPFYPVFVLLALLQFKSMGSAIYHRLRAWRRD